MGIQETHGPVASQIPVGWMERQSSGYLKDKEVRCWQAPISVGYNLLKENIKIKIRS
jgi:hypothetical protein